MRCFTSIFLSFLAYVQTSTPEAILKVRWKRRERFSKEADEVLTVNFEMKAEAAKVERRYVGS